MFTSTCVTFKGWLMERIFTYFPEILHYLCVCRLTCDSLTDPEVFFQRLVSARLASSSSMPTVSSGCKCLIIPSVVFLSSFLQVEYRLDLCDEAASCCLHRQSSVLMKLLTCGSFCIRACIHRLQECLLSAIFLWDLKHAPPSRPPTVAAFSCLRVYVMVRPIPKA